MWNKRVQGLRRPPGLCCRVSGFSASNLAPCVLGNSEPDNLRWGSRSEPAPVVPEVSLEADSATDGQTSGLLKYGTGYLGEQDPLAHVCDDDFADVDAQVACRSLGLLFVRWQQASVSADTEGKCSSATSRWTT